MKKLIMMLAAATAVLLVQAGPGFTYQGVLLEEGNLVKDPTKTITFRIYRDFSGGAALWQSAISVNIATNTGLFSVELSDTAGNRVSDGSELTLREVLSANSGKALYLGLQVEGSSGEIWPRQKILPVPTAMHAEDAAGSSAEEFKVVGTVSARDIKTNSIKVDDTITAKNVSVTGEFLGDGVIPRGGIIMWSGSVSDIPVGWVLCNGQNGTPDLRDKFIIGAGSRYSVGQKGGAETVSLSEDNLPAHSHNMSFTTAGYKAVFNKDSEVLGNTRNNGSVTKTSTSVGSGTAFSILPPYYSLAYIMRRHKN